MGQVYPGQKLIGNVGLWTNGVLGYAYQLLRNGLTFQSGNWTTGVLYIVQQSDVGSVLQLLIMATNQSGTGPYAYSAGVLVAPRALLPNPIIRLRSDMTLAFPLIG